MDSTSPHRALRLSEQALAHWWLRRASWDVPWKDEDYFLEMTQSYMYTEAWKEGPTPGISGLSTHCVSNLIYDPKKIVEPL
jgi:hypothetical protein